MINPTGIWNSYIPQDHDVQVSHSADMLACGAYMTVHKAEIRIKFLTGQFWELSERGQATLSGTTHQGNSLENEIAAVKNVGILLARDWPELLYSPDYPDVSWQEYYTPVPLPIQKKAFKFDVSPLVKITSPNQLTQALKRDTTVVVIKTSGGLNHIIPRLNQYGGKWGLGQYFDSYEVIVKDFQPAEPIVSEWELIITPKIMTNAKLVNNKGEWGFFIPSTSEPTLIDKSLNLGYPLATTDNGTKVDWPNIVADITIS